MVERRRSTIRSAVVWEALQAVLDRPAGRVLQVVDLGGGTGGLAVRVAERGHQVTVVDPSPDALASLERRAAERGVTATITGVLGDAATLFDAVQPGSADLVICHEVLEVVDEPAQALEAAATVLVPGGTLSVLATQRSAAVVGRALAGQLTDARALLAGPAGRGDPTDPMPRLFTQAGLQALVVGAGFTVAEVRGVRVFTDHLSSTVVEEPGAVEALLALESDVATHPDFMALATQLHVLATRGPAAGAPAWT